MNKLRTFLKKNYVISAKDASQILGSRKKVYMLEESEELVKVYPNGMGFFTLPEIEEGVAQFAIVRKYFPQCVVSGPTALSLYQLGQDYISKIHVDIPNTTNLSNPLLKVHRIVEKNINHVQNRKFEEAGIPFKIKIYSPERSLFEAHKYYGVGTENFIRAIKRYRNLYLDAKFPGEQYDTILGINKKVGKSLLSFLSMEDINE